MIDTVTGLLLFLLVCHLSVVHPDTSSDIAAIVKAPLILQCSCSGKVVKWTTYYFYSTETPIAECNSGMCQIEKDFQDRFTFLHDTSAGNFSMTINSTVYNDIGYYKCTCDGKSVSGLHLKVYDPVVVEVFEGDNATLPCYGNTRRDAQDVQWMKDGGKLPVYKYFIADEAAAGRITMSKEGFQTGDLSLRIGSVRHSDASLYLCLIHRGSREGDPRAVLLKVKEHPLAQTPPTPSSCITPNSQIAIYVVLGLLLFLLFISVVIINCVIYCEKSHKKPQQMATNNEAAPVQEETPMMEKVSSTQMI